jgi:hypothetical protein
MDSVKISYECTESVSIPSEFHSSARNMVAVKIPFECREHGWILSEFLLVQGTSMNSFSVRLSKLDISSVMRLGRRK